MQVLQQLRASFAQSINTYCNLNEERAQECCNNNLNFRYCIIKVDGTSTESLNIRKSYPCNEYPLEPHFNIAKLGYAGVYLFHTFLLQNIDCGYSL